ncbi:MAG: methionyl-tRNA formyltransferase [Ignavibacteriaceae bacterium]|nr:methionyl-tRNA formyltransferase [Ignavibacteriaceae bacterium]
MNIVFFATPDFAIPSLEVILNSKHNILAVVTAPDKERGRGQKVSFTPIKEFALKHNLKVFQPEKLSDEDFYNELSELNADLFVVVAFRILPESIFTMPKYGSFNLHGSILPKYRGAAPIQWALLNGDKKTGVTTFKLEKKVDTGNVYLSKEINIEETDNFKTLHDKLSLLGQEAVIETIDMIEQNNFELLKQDDTQASPAPKITKELTQIDWSESLEKNFNKIRAFSPFPGAFFIKANKLFKVYSSSKQSEPVLGEGKFHQTKTELYVGCKDGTLKILEIQPEGKRMMKSDEFVRGYNLNSVNS